MRILYYNPLHAGQGGGSSHAQGVANGLAELGHEVMILPEGVATPWTAPGEQRKRRAPQSIMSLARTLRGMRRSWRIGGATIEAARRFDPDVLLVRRPPYDFIADALLTLPAAARIAEVNGVCWMEAEAFWGHRYDRFEKAREAKYLAACDRICCITDEVRAQVVATGVEGEKTIVIANGVDTRQFSPDVVPDAEAARNLEGADAVIGYCASVSPLHDLITAVTAIERVRSERKGARFLFVGPTRADLVAAGASPGLLEASAVLGRVPHDRVPGLMALMDAGCIALNNDHGSPLKVLEFLAMGVPTAVAAHGSGIDPVRLAEGGLVVSPHDGDALGDALLRLVQDDSVRATLGSNAAAWAAEEATWAMVATRMLDSA